MNNIFTTPAIMSAPMVRALLDGRKLQTRRLVTSQWANLKMHFDQGERCFVWVRETLQNDGDGDWWCAADSAYIPGEYPDGWRRKQSHKASVPSIHMPRWASRLTLEVTDVRLQRLQDIDEADAVAEGIFWQEPTAEDHEHARENSGHDAQGVWIAPGTDCGFGPKEHRQQWHVSAPLAYGLLWDHLHGKGSRDENPEVIAVSFCCHQQNIDALLADRGAV